MKIRIFVTTLITMAVVLLFNSLMGLYIYHLAATSGIEDIWDALGRQSGVIVWVIVGDIGIFLLMLTILLNQLFRPLEDISKKALMGKQASTNYHELEKIVSVLNTRNEEVEKQFEELNEDKKFMERAKRSKDEFIANITHEMNTPLTGIKGYAELLAGKQLDDEQTQMAINTILTQSERLSKMISCVISYNEIDNDSLPPYDVNVSKVVEDILVVVRPEAEKLNVKMRTKIEPNLVITSRFERVHQVIINLISNAIKYNREGGTLDINLYNLDGRIKIEVIDTGIGIKKADLGKIFDRFYTVDKSHNGIGGGFGLGLATVKKICKKSGWIIRVDSVVGEGTTFIVEFN